MRQASITGNSRGRRLCSIPSIMILGALLAFLPPVRGIAQTAFAKYPGSPVITVGVNPGWEALWVNFCSVIYDNSGYVMWYSGGYNGIGINQSVGRATSPDGVTWTKDTLNPVLLHSSSAWNAKAAWIPKVLKIGGAYTMWFTGSTSSDVWQIGRATSTDGRVWVQDSTNPVIAVGAPGKWDAGLVHTSSVLFDGSTYRMWYTGISTVNYTRSGIAGIGLATSADGIHWIKDTLDNPVLVGGPTGAWDHWGVGECSVVWDSARARYEMFYEGNEEDWFGPGTSGIGYAYSSDGIHWTKNTANPVVQNGPGGAWDIEATAPFVLLKNSMYQMWYGGNAGIGYASSPTTGVNDTHGAHAVQSFQLDQNYPNPFNPSTTITFDLPRAGFTTLKVYDLLGNEVRTLLEGELPQGFHQSRFDGTGLSSGVYFYRLRSGSFTQTRKFILNR